MRRSALLAVLIAGFAVAAVPPSFSEVQSLTRSAPSAAAEGMSLTGVSGYRVSVCASAGNTLSGAGAVDIYGYNPVTGLWGINPALRTTVTATIRCQTLPDFDAATLGRMAGWRVLPAANGITVSGGTTVTVSISSCLVGSC